MKDKKLLLALVPKDRNITVLVLRRRLEQAGFEGEEAAALVRKGMVKGLFILDDSLKLGVNRLGSLDISSF